MSSTGADSDEQSSPWKRLRDQFVQNLESVKHTGSFSTFGFNEQFALPSVRVDGIGAIRLPLSCEAAQALIKVSRQAPFGKGSETIVDTSVRDTWEIDGEKISFEKVAWQPWLADILVKVIDELGVAGTVTAQLYKMLLYEEGAKFKAHRDTEKVPGMFGTLVICLPAEHTGGAVLLRHQGKTERHCTEENSAFRVSYAAWYSDVLHEIEPVTSGYRWVLTYNLVNENSCAQQSAAALDDQTNRLGSIVQAFKQYSSTEPKLLWRLSHKYTDDSLKLSSLKGIDYTRVRHVANACQAVEDCIVLLASIEGEEEFYPDDEGQEDKQLSVSLTKIVDLQGQPLSVREIEVDRGMLAQDIPYEDRNPDFQQGGEYLGNEHETITRRYHDSALLILPLKQTVSFLLSGSYTPDQFAKLANILLDRDDRDLGKDQQTLDLLQGICFKALERQPSDERDKYLAPVSRVAAALRDLDLLHHTINSWHHCVSVGAFWAMGQEMDFCFLQQAEKSLLKAFRSAGSLYDLDRGLTAFQKGFKDEGLNRDNHECVALVNKLLNEALRQGLDQFQQPDRRDAAVVIRLTQGDFTYSDEQRTQEFFRRSLKDEAFVNAMTAELLSRSQGSSPPQEVIDTLLPPCLESVVARFQLSEFCSALLKDRSRFGDVRNSGWRYDRKIDKKTQGCARKDATNVALLYEHLRLGLEQSAVTNVLLDKILLQCESLDERTLYSIFAPLMAKLWKVMDKVHERSKTFPVEFLNCCLLRLVEKEPPRPRDYSWPNEAKGRERTKCGGECTTCDEIIAFLLDPDRDRATFEQPTNADYGFFYNHKIWECDTFEDKKAQPMTFTLVKSLRGWQSAHGAWQQSLSAAQRRLDGIVALREILGDDYEAIRNADVTPVTPGRSEADEDVNADVSGKADVEKGADDSVKVDDGDAGEPTQPPRKRCRLM